VNVKSIKRIHHEGHEEREDVERDAEQIFTMKAMKRLKERMK
jgi:hypothetical protein